VRFLLDTNAVIGLLKGSRRLQDNIQRHSPQDFALSAIVAHELFFGACRSQTVADNLARLDALAFETLDPDREDARHAAEIRADLTAAGTPIGPYDALIAGQAKARALILITRNVGELSCVVGLRFENWEN
jgi:tRNA(fMet)-specific endonuclease VapC